MQHLICLYLHLPLKFKIDQTSQIPIFPSYTEKYRQHTYITYISIQIQVLWKYICTKRVLNLTQHGGKRVLEKPTSASSFYAGEFAATRQTRDSSSFITQHIIASTSTSHPHTSKNRDALCGVAAGDALYIKGRSLGFGSTRKLNAAAAG